MSRRFIEHLHMGYEQTGKAAALSAAAGKYLMLFSAHAHNRTGATIDMGLLKKFNSSYYSLGLLVAANTPDFTAVSDIENATSTSLFTTTNNSGFLVQAQKTFGFIGLNVTQAQTGAPVYTYEYYNGASYTTLTTIAVPNYASTGEKLIVFAAPRDWAVGTTATVGGVSNMYSIRVLATTAPGQDVIANSLNVCQFLHYQEGMSDNSTLSLNFPYTYPMFLESGEGLMPYFSTASANNTVTSLYMNAD